MLRYLTLMVFIAIWTSSVFGLPASVDPVNPADVEKSTDTSKNTDDLETDATFWGGYGGWGRRHYYGGWGGRPYYYGWGGRGYGWGGRGYGWGGGYYGGGWGRGYRGWGGYYW